MASEADRAPTRRVQFQTKKARGLGCTQVMTGTLEGPADWSQELDHYLSGTPKRGESNEWAAERLLFDSTFIAGLINSRDQLHLKAKDFLPLVEAAAEVVISQPTQVMPWRTTPLI